MLSIALCDDESKEVKKTLALLNAYKEVHTEIAFTVQCFESMESLFFSSDALNTFQILLLDIYMGKQNGIEGAKELRKKGFTGNIVFLTTSSEHALSAYAVNADQYLLKPIDQNAFFQTLDKVFALYKAEKRRKITLKVGGETQSVFVRDIVFSETKKNYQNIYLLDGTVLCARLTREELSKLLFSFPEFIFMGASYIINLDQIQSMNAKEIWFRKDNVLMVPRGSYKEIKKQFLDFHCGV